MHFARGRFSGTVRAVERGLFEGFFIILRKKQSRVSLVTIALVCQLADFPERLRGDIKICLRHLAQTLGPLAFVLGSTPEDKQTRETQKQRRGERDSERGRKRMTACPEPAPFSF